MHDIGLGPFRLRRRLATGGMGEVWAGVHVEREVPVAVKLIRAEMFGEESKRHFEQEVWAQARIDHPSVVYLFDHGLLPAEAAAGVSMAPGAPWLAMEMCSSTLADLVPTLDWETLRNVLVPLLEALAHAHSRGVLHRDIKLSNVLVATASDLRPGVKLADFGIAHALADEDEETRAAGTPRYMAPEQVTGDWEQLGPWTDLYALGMLAWRLVMGRRPWAALHGRKLLLAMIHHDLGWFDPVIEVPPSLRTWLMRLTQKVPARRYQLAADALADFLALSVEAVDGLWLPNISTLTGTLIPEDHDEEVSRRLSFVNPTQDPPSSTETSIRMNAAGLGLLPMRQPEFIGRRIERRVLWDMLQQVSKSGRPIAVSLLGPPRVGRGRFQRWFSEAAECAGQAVCVWIDCLPGRSLGPQLLRSLRAWFRVGALDHAAAMEHVETWLGSQVWVPELVNMLRTLQLSPHWLQTLSSTLAALGRVRPLIVQLRGAAGNPHVQEFVDALLSHPRTAVMVVVDAPLQQAEVVELAPLDDASMTRLADALVALEPAVRASLVRRASGSPGYLMQTLLHWSRQGMLLPDTHGFRFEGDLAEVPPTLVVVANSRLAALEERFDADTLGSLTVAAVIGQTVEIDLWERVDGADRADPRRRLLKGLSQLGLVQEEVARFRFSSVAFRETVLAREAAKLPELHRRCASQIHGEDQALELGRHLMAAGAPREALDPLRMGLYHRVTHAGGRAAMAECSLLHEAVDQLKGSERLHWSAIVQEVEAAIHLDLGALVAAENAARAALEVAVRLKDVELAARCWAHIGAVAGHRGRIASRRQAFQHALELGVDVNPALRSAWWTALGTAYLGLGDLDAWGECLVHAAVCVQEDPQGRDAYRIGLAEAVAAQLDQRIPDALHALSEAYAAAAEAGSTRGKLTVLRARAHTLVHDHQFEAAHRAFLASLELAVLVRPSRAPVLLANAVALGFLLEHSDAAVDLYRRHRFLLPPGQDGARRRLSAHCAGLAVASIHHDWRLAQYHLRHLGQHDGWMWSEVMSNLVLCEVAVRSAVRAGQVGLGREVAELALAASSGEPELRNNIRAAAGLDPQ